MFCKCGLIFVKNVPTKLFLEKSTKWKKIKKIIMKASTIFGGFWGQNLFFIWISETAFLKTVIPKQFFLFFLLYTQGCL